MGAKRPIRLVLLKFPKLTDLKIVRIKGTTPLIKNFELLLNLSSFSIRQNNKSFADFQHFWKKLFVILSIHKPSLGSYKQIFLYFFIL